KKLALKCSALKCAGTEVYRL
uniref:Venom protein n=1 Tax=Globodera pallida TaxID=36090 RepID=A0A183CSJ0_GLOPA